MRIPLGPYRLLAPLGRGSSAEVWAAFLRDRPVAVKIMTGPDADSPAWKRRFRAEVRAMSRLDHPNIAAVLDYGEIGAATAACDGRLTAGAPYIVLERISGGSLKTAPQPMPWERLRALLLDLLAALGHAHARGVVHRDIKPANVLLSAPEDARPGLKLTDFGIARGGGEDHDEAPGTPFYSAPEQILGKVREQGPWTDLYALGALTWRLATGRPMFGDLAGPALWTAQVERSPFPFEPAVPVPSGLGGWLRTLLAKDPRDRFQSALEAADALRLLGIGCEDDEDTLVTAGPRLLPKPPPSWCPPPSSRERIGLSLLCWRTPPLLGREPECRILWDALRHVHRSGRGRAILVHGPPGSGKTRLVEQVACHADESGAAQVIRVVPQSSGTVGAALQAVYDLEGLDPVAMKARILALDPKAPADALAALASRGRVAISPKIWADRVDLVGGVLRRAARRTVLLWIDGPDEDSLPLVESLGSAPVLSIVTSRSEADRPKGAAIVELRPLPGDTLAALLRELADLDEATVGTIEAEAQGNPGWAVARLQDLVRRDALVETPGGLHAKDSVPPEDLVVRWRLPLEDLANELGEGARDALRIAAALGPEVDPDEWEAAFLGASQERMLPTNRVSRLKRQISVLEKARARLVEKGWVEASAAGLRFAFSELRAAILDEATRAGQLAAVHGRCADALAGRRVDAIRLGRHQWLAGRVEDGAQTLWRGALEAAEAGLLREAITALDLGEAGLPARRAEAAGLRSDWTFRLGLVDASLAWAEEAVRRGDPSTHRVDRATAVIRGTSPPTPATTLEDTQPGHVAATCLARARNTRDVIEAIELLERGLAACESRDSLPALRLRVEAVSLDLAAGRLEEARAGLAAVEHVAGHWGELVPRLNAIGLHLAAAMDDPDAVDARLARLRALPSVPPDPALAAELERVLPRVDPSRRGLVTRIAAQAELR